MYCANKLAPVEIGNIFCWSKESEEGQQVSGLGFLGCDRWSNKISSHLVLEWSDDPEKSIVVSGALCSFWEFIAIGQIPVDCWVTAVFQPSWWLRWLDFWWHVMEENEFAQASVSPWSITTLHISQHAHLNSKNSIFNIKHCNMYMNSNKYFVLENTGTNIKHNIHNNVLTWIQTNACYTYNITYITMLHMKYS